MTKRQKDKKDNTKYNKDKDRGPEGPPRPLQELEQGGQRPPKF